MDLNITKDTTKHLRIEIYDYDADGNAVWKVSLGRDIRYVEAFVESGFWDIVELALRALDEEEETA